MPILIWDSTRGRLRHRCLLPSRRLLLACAGRAHADLSIFGLFLAKQITCATNIEIVACQRETGAKRIQRLHDFQPFFMASVSLIAGQCQIAIRAGLDRQSFREAGRAALTQTCRRGE